MKNIIIVFLFIIFCSCASTRYIRFEIINGTGSYNAFTQSVKVNSGTIRFYKAVSNNDEMNVPEHFFERIEP